MIETKYLALVADGAVGKTSLIHSYIHGKPSLEYLPTIFDDYAKIITYKGKVYQLKIRDTAGQEDYDSLRTISYNGLDVVILCFNLISPASFDNIKTKWLPELNYYLPGIAKILVATKSDLRTDKSILQRLQNKGLKPITTEEGYNLARSIGIPYIECSAFDSTEKINSVFELAISQLVKAPVKRKKCILL